MRKGDTGAVTSSIGALLGTDCASGLVVGATAGSSFCCVGALAITGSLHHVDKDLLGWWLCERQVKSGGLNGRPEKLPDVSSVLI